MSMTTAPCHSAHIVDARRRGRLASPSEVRGISPEAPLGLVNVAPRPRRPGHDGSHHGMARRTEVLCRVLARRGVATSDVAARPALPELDPAGAQNEAILTG